jgi:hypothetical protein
MFQINGHEISGFTPETFPQALARAAAALLDGPGEGENR